MKTSSIHQIIKKPLKAEKQAEGRVPRNTKDSIKRKGSYQASFPWLLASASGKGGSSKFPIAPSSAPDIRLI